MTLEDRFRELSAATLDHANRRRTLAMMESSLAAGTCRGRNCNILQAAGLVEDARQQVLATWRRMQNAAWQTGGPEALEELRRDMQQQEQGLIAAVITVCGE